MANRPVTFTADEMAIVTTALAIWEATPAGGDISEEDKAELRAACESARAKLSAAQGLSPRPASLES